MNPEGVTIWLVQFPRARTLSGAGGSRWGDCADAVQGLPRRPVYQEKAERLAMTIDFVVRQPRRIKNTGLA